MDDVRENDQCLFFVGVTIILAEEGFTGTRHSENESISVYQLLSIADIHILADLVDTIVIARAIIKLLHIKWHKYSK